MCFNDLRGEKPTGDLLGGGDAAPRRVDLTDEKKRRSGTGSTSLEHSFRGSENPDDVTGSSRSADADGAKLEPYRTLSSSFKPDPISPSSAKRQQSGSPTSGDYPYSVANDDAPLSAGNKVAQQQKKPGKGSSRFRFGSGSKLGEGELLSVEQLEKTRKDIERRKQRQPGMTGTQPLVWGHETGASLAL